MNDLIEALMIFAKYQPECQCPTSCEHDVLYVMDVDLAGVSRSDQERLTALGFEYDSLVPGWYSFRFGSA